MKNQIEWLGHASVRIIGEKVVYVDPWKLCEASPKMADVILVTHSHYDHCSHDDVKKIRGKTTVVVAPRDCITRIGGNVRPIAPGEEMNLDGVLVRAIPAYNIGKDFHPKKHGWVGYVVTMGGESIYVAGDTDVIPEMNALKVDVAMMPVGGTYTMTAEEAAEAVNRFQPRLAIPIHYGDIVGSSEDAQKFVSLCKVSAKMLTPTR